MSSTSYYTLYSQIYQIRTEKSKIQQRRAVFRIAIYEQVYVQVLHCYNNLVYSTLTWWYCELGSSRQ